MFFVKNFPLLSRYEELLLFMEADTFYALWRQPKTRIIFQNAIERYKNI